MSDKDDVTEDEQQGDEVAPEAKTTFATKGVGWSGREGGDGGDDDLNVVELDK